MRCNLFFPQVHYNIIPGNHWSILICIWLSHTFELNVTSNKWQKKKENTLPCAGYLQYYLPGRRLGSTGNLRAWYCLGMCSSCILEAGLQLLGWWRPAAAYFRRVLLLTRGLCLHRWLSIYTVQLSICTGYKKEYHTVSSSLLSRSSNLTCYGEWHTVMFMTWKGFLNTNLSSNNF